MGNGENVFWVPDALAGTEAGTLEAETPDADMPDAEPTILENENGKDDAPETEMLGITLGVE